MIKENIKTIILNVRGIKYEVILDSFNEFQNTRLGILSNQIKNKNYDEISKLCDRYNDDLNEFYFNRDPYVLNMILNYYQTKRLHLNNDQCVLFIKSELEYWHIETNLLQACCLSYYRKKHYNLNELIQLENKVIKSFQTKIDYGFYFPKLREKIWNLFDNPNSSIYATLIFYFYVFLILVVTNNLSEYLLILLY
jgi:hypothetical protein